MRVSRFELPGDPVSAARLCLAARLPAGDPAGLRAVAGRSAGWAAQLRRVAAVLLSGAESSLWAGAAARAFTEQLSVDAPSLAATADRYDGYAVALTGYAAVLDEAGPRLRAARDRLAQVWDQPGGAAAASDGFRADGFGTGRLGGQPSPDLLAAARDFKAGYDQWADALDRCVRALSEADHADPTRDRPGWSALGQHLSHAAGAYLSPFERAVLHPSLGNVSACLGSLNAAFTVLGLGLLLICPPAAAVCLTAATVLAAAQVAVDTTRRERGEQVSAGSLGLELAAAIPIGGNAVRGLRAAGKVTHLVPGGGLMAHEGIDGGHTLAKHVGKTEAFLRNRLATEPGIKAASTFHDRQSAEKVLSVFIDMNAAEITRWLRGNGFELILQGRTAHFAGLVIPRTATRTVEAAGIRLVLRRSPITGVGFRIHTAMVTL